MHRQQWAPAGLKVPWDVSMIIERRHLFQSGLATLAAGATVWPIKAWWDTVAKSAPDRRAAAINSPANTGEIADPAPMAMAATFGAKTWSSRASDVKRAFLHNAHTGEILNVVYFENGRYVAGALMEAKHVLRDWRNNQQHFIHPHLFDLLHDLRAKLDITAPFQIWSGYRSPTTNAMLHAHSEQVASKSQHLLGKALDISVQGVNLARLHAAAMSLRAGGVGYYPESGFVHVDVGPLRQWAGA